jgi:hypothetical protein
MENQARMPSTEGHVPPARGIPRSRAYRLLRRYHRVLSVIMLTMYIISDVLMMFPGEMKVAQALLHIAIGIAHSLA